MKEITEWHSDRLQRPVRLVRWGHYGTPVLVFPTAGGDAEEIERFHLIGALRHLIEGGRIKVYSCDSYAGRAWLEGHHPPDYCARLQNQFDAFIYAEAIPAIRLDCRDEGIEVITAGASIGAFNAVAALCRHPDVFRLAIGMSGTFDLSKLLRTGDSEDLYFASPLHFLPNLAEGSILHQLRRRFVLLPTGEGRWEDPAESWRMAETLGAKGIPNRVDPWGTQWDHDWVTWREMLPHYLATHA